MFTCRFQVHGSFLTQERFNDIDIAVYIDENVVNEVVVVELEIDMGLEIEREINIPVDIKFLNFAPLSFQYQASCGHLLFSNDDDQREEFLCNTWSQYFDFFPIAQDYLQEVLSV
ncbi:MAG: nucleotidyltransferase domain-containing protein [bacterium]|nr:nucleotidyltransferase domain-containing protein [bacterium]